MAFLLVNLGNQVLTSWWQQLTLAVLLVRM
jgi:hypothetical protein